MMPAFFSLIGEDPHSSREFSETLARVREQVPSTSHLLGPFPNVMNYNDDVIIIGASEKEHDKPVRDVCIVFS